MLPEIPDTVTLSEAKHWLEIRRARQHGNAHISTADGANYQWNTSRRIFERVDHLPAGRTARAVVAPPPAPRSRFWAGVRKGLLFRFLLGWFEPPGGGHCHRGYDSNY
jgi:hypothetical protein